MTQQYLAGELSVLLARLAGVAGDEASARALTGLRREAETLPVTALCAVTQRAVDLIDAACWDSITKGDTEAFRHQARAAVELYEFGTCAGLLVER